MRNEAKHCPFRRQSRLSSESPPRVTLPNCLRIKQAPILCLHATFNRANCSKRLEMATVDLQPQKKICLTSPSKPNRPEGAHLPLQTRKMQKTQVYPSVVGFAVCASEMVCDRTRKDGRSERSCVKPVAAAELFNPAVPGWFI